MFECIKRKPETNTMAKTRIKDKSQMMINQKAIQKTNDWGTRTTQQTGGELRCPHGW